MKTRLFQGMIAAILVAPPLGVQADSGTVSFVQVAAAIRAGAELCHTYSADELDKLREQQRATVAEMGMNAKEFDQVFEARHAEMTAMLAAASQTEIAEVCEDMKTFPIDQWR